MGPPPRDGRWTIAYMARGWVAAQPGHARMGAQYSRARDGALARHWFRLVTYRAEWRRQIQPPRRALSPRHLRFNLPGALSRARQIQPPLLSLSLGPGRFNLLNLPCSLSLGPGRFNLPCSLSLSLGAADSTSPALSLGEADSTSPALSLSLGTADSTSPALRA
eukprot:SAG31_NODE_2282_length_6017_cov_16.322237_5_plen_164_part_00